MKDIPYFIKNGICDCYIVRSAGSTGCTLKMKLSVYVSGWVEYIKGCNHWSKEGTAELWK